MSKPRLSDTQFIILKAAASREDGAILPLPGSLKLQGGAASSVFRSLLKRGLIEDRQAREARDTLRITENAQPIGLAITAAGLEAIGTPRDVVVDAASTTNSTSSALAKITKQAKVLGLLRRKHGASLPEMMELTGWQAHSVRGFLSGTVRRKLDFPLVVELEPDGERRYHVAALCDADD